jgi:hypothetical protein
MKRTIIIAAVLLLAAICLPFLWQKSPDNPPPASPPAETAVTYSFSTPEEYMIECRRLSDIFWETYNTETRQKWYELSEEASKRFPNNPKIMGDFAFISRFYQFPKNPVECLAILQPFYDNSETHADIAYSVWSQFNHGITNKHNLEYDDWDKILKDCGDPLETLKIMETYWAQKIPNATATLKTNSHPQLITEAAQRDINMEDAERRWQIIKANLAAYTEKQEELKNFLSMPNPPTLPTPPSQEKMLSKRLKDWLKDKFNFKPRAKIKLE